jgi:hypothetical protein
MSDCFMILCLAGTYPFSEIYHSILLLYYNIKVYLLRNRNFASIIIGYSIFQFLVPYHDDDIYINCIRMWLFYIGTRVVLEVGGMIGSLPGTPPPSHPPSLRLSGTKDQPLIFKSWPTKWESRPEYIKISIMYEALWAGFRRVSFLQPQINTPPPRRGKAHSSKNLQSVAAAKHWLAHIHAFEFPTRTLIGGFQFLDFIQRQRRRIYICFMHP